MVSAKPVAFVTALRERPPLPHTRRRYALVLLLFTPFLLAVKSIKPTPAPAGPMIIITPLHGSPSAFELVRVEPDRVEVRKEGVRLQFARHQIRQIRVPEAGDLVLEAVGILSRVEAEDLSAFETLLPELEAKIPPLTNLANRFGWLIPDASSTLIAIEQASKDMKSTLQATANLQETGKRIEAMANGSLPLSATWEDQINLALAETNRIPYMKIRKETLDRFLSIRRKIRLDLTQANQEATVRARNLLEDLHSELQAGTLTEAGSELLIKETRRYVERVLEPSERASLESQLAKATGICQKWFSDRAVRESSKVVQSLLVTAQAEISASSPTVNLTSVLPRVFQLRRLVAEIPESTTKNSLSTQLASLEETLRTLPPPRVKEGPDVAQDGEQHLPGPAMEMVKTAVPVGQAAQVKSILQNALTDWRFWAGISLFLFLLNFRKRKTSPTVAIQPASPPKSDFETSGSIDSYRKPKTTPVPAFPEMIHGKESTSWKEGIEDPLQQANGSNAQVELDAYGCIKKKRNTQG